MILLYALSIIAICSAQEATDFSKIENRNEVKVQRQKDGIDALIREVGEMGLLLESYRRIILDGITETSDMCGFIDKLIDNDEDVNQNRQDASTVNDGMGVLLYKNFFQKLNDPVLKSQLFAALENHIDNCFRTTSPNQLLVKRDKSQLQKVRFHSWGGKRSRGGPKVVIRTPFHAWGGKRSGIDV